MTKRKEEVRKVEIHDVKIDPIVCQMPKMIARFVRFETGPTGNELFVIYKIIQEGYEEPL